MRPNATAPAPCATSISTARNSRVTPSASITPEAKESVIARAHFPETLHHRTDSGPLSGAANPGCSRPSGGSLRLRTPRFPSQETLRENRPQHPRAQRFSRLHPQPLAVGVDRHQPVLVGPVNAHVALLEPVQYVP